MRRFYFTQSRLRVLLFIAILIVFPSLPRAAAGFPKALPNFSNPATEFAQYRGRGRNMMPAPQRRDVFRQQRQRAEQQRVVRQQRMETMRQTRTREAERLRQFRVQQQQALEQRRRLLSDQRQHAQSRRQDFFKTRQAAHAPESKSATKASAAVGQQSVNVASLLAAGTILTPKFQEKIVVLSNHLPSNNKNNQLNLTTTSDEPLRLLLSKDFNRKSFLLFQKENPDRSRIFLPSEAQKKAQAKHAWETEDKHTLQPRSETLWKKLGFENESQLIYYADDIRRNHDRVEPLRENRIIYGKYLDTSRKAGIIVIDQVDGDNVGTIMKNGNMMKAIDRLKMEK